MRYTNLLLPLPSTTKNTFTHIGQAVIQYLSLPLSQDMNIFIHQQQFSCLSVINYRPLLCSNDIATKK